MWGLGQGAEGGKLLTKSEVGFCILLSLCRVGTACWAAKEGDGRLARSSALAGKTTRLCVPLQ